jgi:hypothetical protein
MLSAIIVILRDGGCILRDTPHASACNGYAKDGHLILQADHLITRANSATYGDGVQINVPGDAEPGGDRNSRILAGGMGCCSEEEPMKSG